MITGLTRPQRPGSGRCSVLVIEQDFPGRSFIPSSAPFVHPHPPQHGARWAHATGDERGWEAVGGTRGGASISGSHLLPVAAGPRGHRCCPSSRAGQTCPPRLTGGDLGRSRGMTPSAPKARQVVCQGQQDLLPRGTAPAPLPRHRQSVRPTLRGPAYQLATGGPAPRG